MPGRAPFKVRVAGERYRGARCTYDLGFTVLKEFNRDLILMEITVAAYTRNRFLRRMVRIHKSKRQLDPLLLAHSSHLPQDDIQEIHLARFMAPHREKGFRPLEPH